MIWKTGVYVYAMNIYACTHYSLHPALVIFLLYIKMRDHFSYTHNAQGIGLLHRRTRWFLCKCACSNNCLQMRVFKKNIWSFDLTLLIEVGCHIQK